MITKLAIALLLSHGSGFGSGELLIAQVTPAAIPIPHSLLTTPYYQELLMAQVTPAAIARPVLTIGNQGTAVSELQAALKLLGYYSGAVDGVYGETTAQAVTRFQQAAGIAADGVAGADTWNRLLPTTSPTPPIAVTPTPAPTPPPSSDPTLPILREGMRGAAVSQLQERLRSLGFYQGAIDGVFGSLTTTAVISAQQKFKLDPDGVVGQATWSALQR